MRTILAIVLVACLAGLSVCLAGPVVGWRTDGSGKYPSADPPTEWSMEKNVVWSTPGSAWSPAPADASAGRSRREPPVWSNATPVIVGEKIFINSELTNLVCLNKADGKVLWVRGNAYEDYMTDRDRAQAERDKVQADRIRKEEIGPTQKQINDLRKEIQKLQPLTTQPDSAADAKARIEAIKPQIAAGNKALKEANARLLDFTRWEMPGTNGTNGHSSPTPASDGKVVCVAYNTGTAACYDLDGNRKWITWLDKPVVGSYGISASPVLFGNRVLVGVQALYALDLQTGKELWRNDQVELRFGTPTTARLGEFDVVITAGGDVVRISDGKLLAKRLCVLGHSAPIFQDGVAYFVQNGGKAIKLSRKGLDEIEAKVLWTTRLKSSKGNFYASALLHDGLIYAINQAGVLYVIDAADGGLVYEKTLDLGKGTVYSSVTLAGRCLFVSSDNGTTLVLAPGREYKEVARNSLETFRSCSVFEGKRLYVRAYKKMYCIGQ